MFRWQYTGSVCVLFVMPYQHTRLKREVLFGRQTRKSRSIVGKEDEGPQGQKWRKSRRTKKILKKRPSLSGPERYLVIARREGKRGVNKMPFVLEGGQDVFLLETPKKRDSMYMRSLRGDNMFMRSLRGGSNMFMRSLRAGNNMLMRSLKRGDNMYMRSLRGNNIFMRAVQKKGDSNKYPYMRVLRGGQGGSDSMYFRSLRTSQGKSGRLGNMYVRSLKSGGGNNMFLRSLRVPKIKRGNGNSKSNNNRGRDIFVRSLRSLSAFDRGQPETLKRGKEEDEEEDYSSSMLPSPLSVRRTTLLRRRTIPGAYTRPIRSIGEKKEEDGSKELFTRLVGGGMVETRSPIVIQPSQCVVPGPSERKKICTPGAYGATTNMRRRKKRGGEGLSPRPSSSLIRPARRRRSSSC